MLSFADYRKKVLSESITRAKTFPDFVSLKFDQHRLDLLEALRLPRMLNESHGDLDALYEVVLEEFAKEDHRYCGVIVDHYINSAKRVCLDIILSEADAAADAQAQGGDPVEALKANIQAEIERVMGEIKQALLGDVATTRQEPQQPPGGPAPGNAGTMPPQPQAPPAGDGVTDQRTMRDPSQAQPGAIDNRIVKRRGLRGWWDWMKSWFDPAAWKRWNQQRQTMGKLKDLLAYNKAPNFQNNINTQWDKNFRQENFNPLLSFVENVYLEQNDDIAAIIDKFTAELVASVHKQIDAYAGNLGKVPGEPVADNEEEATNVSKNDLLAFLDKKMPKVASECRKGLTLDLFRQMFGLNVHGLRRMYLVGTVLGFIDPRYRFRDVQHKINFGDLHFKIERVFKRMGVVTAGAAAAPAADATGLVPGGTPEPKVDPGVATPPPPVPVKKKQGPKDTAAAPAAPQEDQPWLKRNLFQDSGLSERLSLLWQAVHEQLRSHGVHLTPEMEQRADSIMKHTAAEMHDKEPINFNDFEHLEQVADMIANRLEKEMKVKGGEHPHNSGPGMGVPARRPGSLEEPESAEKDDDLPEINLDEPTDTTTTTTAPSTPTTPAPTAPPTTPASIEPSTAPTDTAPPSDTMPTPTTTEPPKATPKDKYEYQPHDIQGNEELIGDIRNSLQYHGMVSDLSQLPKGIIPHMIGRAKAADPNFDSHSEFDKRDQLVDMIANELGLEPREPPEDKSTATNTDTSPHTSTAPAAPVAPAKPTAPAAPPKPISPEDAAKSQKLEGAIVNHVGEILKSLYDTTTTPDLIKSWISDSLPRDPAKRLETLDKWYNSPGREMINGLAKELYKKIQSKRRDKQANRHKKKRPRPFRDEDDQRDDNYFYGDDDAFARDNDGDDER